MAQEHIFRKPITDNDRIEWTLAKYGDSHQKHGGMATLATLKARFKRSEAVISRGIRQAFSRGLVKVIVEKSFAEIPQRNNRLEELLLEMYPGLKTAIVIDVDAPPSSSENLSDYDDNVHKKLGTALAAVITTSLIDLDGKAVALSSGRGVHYVVQGLKKHKLRANNVSLLSLTGDVFFPTSLTPFAPMDANRNVQDMYECLPNDTFINTIKAPLAPPRKDLYRYLKNTWLGRWKENRPDYAIIGVGVLYKGHRFWDYALTPPQELKSFLNPIAETLKLLVASCNEIIKKNQHYYPVADIANHFFFVEPPNGAIITSSQKSTIQKLIKKINEQLINVRADQLKEIPHLILVAGSSKKTFAIRKMLERNNNLTCLTVDSEVATKIMGLK